MDNVNLARNYLKKINSLELFIKKNEGLQVRNERKKKKIQLFIDDYFRTQREALLQTSSELPINNIDTLMQDMLSLTHKDAIQLSYLQILSELKKSFQEIDKITLVVQLPRNEMNHSEIDIKIIETLNKIVPSAAKSYEQALIDLRSDKRLSWRGPATDIREAIRETLDYLAPDDDVMKESGFKFEADCKGPTMRQKAKFILKNRKVNDTELSNNQASLQVIEDSVGAYIRTVYKRANVSTHTPTEKPEVLRIKQHAVIVFQEILSL